MKVSLIIPVYNVASYIANCLESVYYQTYSDIEVLLVNDCTLDNSMEVAALYIAKLKERYEVVVINHERNKGLSAARNTGVRAATGEYIYFLDSDDEITKDCIGLLAEKVVKYRCVDFVIAGVKVMGDNTKYPICMPEYSDSKQEIEDGLLLGNWYVMAWNKLIRRLMFLENKLWFEEGLLHEDELFSFKLAFVAQTMSVVDCDTYIYKTRIMNSITSQRKLKNFEDILIINKYRFDYLSANCINKDLLLNKYLINCTYLFLITVVINANVSIMEKKYLINRQLEIYKSIKLKRSHGDIFEIVKKSILHLPYYLLRLFAILNYRIAICKYSKEK